jgi:hypothetical protein
MRMWSTIRRIQVVRVEVGHPRSPRRPFLASRVFSRRRHAPLAAATIALLGVWATPALAASSGSSTATINVAPSVLSVSVSPTTVTFAKCAGGTSTSADLGFPDGECNVGTLPDDGQSVGGVDVTNTGEASQIDVNGSNATPSDNGTPWTLCSNIGNCSNGANPGANQFSIQSLGWYGSIGNSVMSLTNTPSCDSAFSNGGTSDDSCSATTGASEDEQLLLTGPQSSTDTSSVFTTTLTWTAVPST